jgi:DNA-binding NarL/FixJ family response regulator
MAPIMTSKLLCIEDDAESRELLAEALVERGFDVSVAKDGESGLELMLSSVPDLVICDIMLPGLSGFEIIERLAAVPDERMTTLPFIFLTALDDRDSILRGRRLGADDYVTKPVDFDILAEIVKRRLGPNGRGPQAVPPPLSSREIEILTWVARGKSSMDIGALIGISERTVEYHVEKSMRKLGVATRVQAAIKASRLKLIGF